MNLPALHWRVIMLIELITFVSFVIVMDMQGAPTWALTLLIFIALRPSRLVYASDLGALQSTIKAVLEQLSEEDEE